MKACWYCNKGGMPDATVTCEHCGSEDVYPEDDGGWPCGGCEKKFNFGQLVDRRCSACRGVKDRKKVGPSRERVNALRREDALRRIAEDMRFLRDFLWGSGRMRAALRWNEKEHGGETYWDWRKRTEPMAKERLVMLGIRYFAAEHAEVHEDI